MQTNLVSKRRISYANTMAVMVKGFPAFLSPGMDAPDDVIYEMPMGDKGKRLVITENSWQPANKEYPIAETSVGFNLLTGDIFKLVKPATIAELAGEKPPQYAGQAQAYLWNAFLNLALLQGYNPENASGEKMTQSKKVNYADLPKKIANLRIEALQTLFSIEPKAYNLFTTYQQIEPFINAYSAFVASYGPEVQASLNVYGQGAVVPETYLLRVQHTHSEHGEHRRLVFPKVATTYGHADLEKQITDYAAKLNSKVEKGQPPIELHQPTLALCKSLIVAEPEKGSVDPTLWDEEF